MKNFYSIFKIAGLFIALNLLSLSCTQENSFIEPEYSKISIVSKSENHIDYSKYAPLLSETVSVNDAILYAKMVAKTTGRTVSEIEMYREESDTLAYYINYSEGWEMISANRKAGLRMIASPVSNINSKSIPELLQSTINDYLETIKHISKEEKPDYSSESYTTWISLYPNLIFKSDIITKTIPDHFDYPDRYCDFCNILYN